MNKNPVYLLAFIIVLILVVVGHRFQDYVLNENFYLNVATSCNPETESCFVADCSVEDDPECNETPYKKVEILKKEAPTCLEEHSCENFSCDSIESCSVLSCMGDNIDDGEKCFITDEKINQDENEN